LFIQLQKEYFLSYILPTTFKKNQFPNGKQRLSLQIMIQSIRRNVFSIAPWVKQIFFTFPVALVTEGERLRRKNVAESAVFGYV
jgi:hypothetical protein